MRDYYNILGVKKKERQEEIKRAYYPMAQVHNPDKGGSNGKFNDLSEAYRALKDPTSRAHYDRFGMAMENSEQLIDQLLGIIFQANANDYVLDPLDQLTAVEKDLVEKTAVVKEKLAFLRSDVKQLREENDEDVYLVLRSMEKTIMVCERTLEDHKFRTQACVVVRKHFEKAKKILGRKRVIVPESTGGWAIVR